MRHTIRAILIAILYFVFLIALPLGFVISVSSYILSAGGDSSKYFHNTSLYILVLGTLTTLFAALSAYYEKGDKKRLAYGILSAVFLVLWGYFFIESMSIYYEGDTYAYEVLVPGIGIAIAISLSFKIIYRVVEYYAYRGDFENGGMENSNMGDQNYDGENMYF
jgi:hypothetical protein